MNGNGQNYAPKKEEAFLSESMEEVELTEEELENYTSAGNYKELLDFLNYEQLQYVKNSGLLSLPEVQVRAVLGQMIAENKKRPGM